MAARRRPNAASEPAPHARRQFTQSPWFWLSLAVVVGVGGGLWLRRTFRQEPNPGSPGSVASVPEAIQPVIDPATAVYARYAGSESCRECHQAAYDLWVGSNHGLAERPLRPELDRRAFDPPRTFTHASQSTQVRLRGGHYEIVTLGPDRQVEPYAVERVIGHDPLRQFLVRFPGGRWQTLEASYDPQGDDWFNVYGTEDRQPGEWGHWTGRGMNWNNMCAGCHNTRVRKNYHAASDSYHTAMFEPTVGCEACHGPLKAHGEWRRLHPDPKEPDPTLAKLTKAAMLDACGACHSRRAEITGDFQPGDPYLDHFSLVTVDDSDTYYPDGQVRDENYEFAAFLGSRMHFRGVWCGDCHEPHSAKTLLPGNWLCLRCHNGSDTNAPVIDPLAHSHHQVFGYGPDGQPVEVDLLEYRAKTLQHREALRSGQAPALIASLTRAVEAARRASTTAPARPRPNPANAPTHAIAGAPLAGVFEETGGECVSCHMPQTVYMQRHWRHDHGYTIPDPLLTKQAGIPNACNRCHTDKDVAWALTTVEQWYGPRMDRPTRRRAQTIAAARLGADPGPLLDLLDHEEIPYWRSVAIALLERSLNQPRVAGAIQRRLDDPDPLIREKAVRVLDRLVEAGHAEVVRGVRARLNDPVRSVRVAAAWALRTEVDPNTLAARELAHQLETGADQPTGQLQLGVWQLARQGPGQALAHLQRAVAWDGGSAPLRHELAVILSMLGRTAEALEQLQAASRLAPREAEYAFKLGLAWNELGDSGQTLAALERAVQLDPRHGRAWYNLGLARNVSGQAEPALDALQRAESLESSDPVIPYARATILARLGRIAEARAAASRALEIRRDFPAATQLLQQLPR